MEQLSHPNFNDLTLELDPVRVVQSVEQLRPSLKLVHPKDASASVSSVRNVLDRKSVFLNGTNGEGVDGWMTLLFNDLLLLMLDQRKREGANLAPFKLEDYHKKAMKAKPKEHEGPVAIGIFSSISKTSEGIVDSDKVKALPSDWFFVVREQVESYYGPTFSEHPAVTADFFINDALVNATAIRYAIEADPKRVALADAIVKERETQHFVDMDDLRKRLNGWMESAEFKKAKIIRTNVDNLQLMGHVHFDVL